MSEPAPTLTRRQFLAAATTTVAATRVIADRAMPANAATTAAEPIDTPALSARPHETLLGVL